jgi:hypothetical protein
MSGSEVAFMNVSGVHNQTENEFPHWRSVVSLLLLCLWLFAVLLTTLLSSSVLLAIKKSKNFDKVLSTVHIYVLVLNIIVRLCSAMTFSGFIPPAIRFCDCSIVAGAISFYLNTFSICYQPYMFVSLALFQLLIIRGKKRFVTYKTVGVTLITITAVAIVVPLIFIGIAVQDGENVLCDSSLGCFGIDTRRLMGIFASFYSIVWVPSFSLLLVATIWSCVIFKKEYIGNDAYLNRRIIAMPLILPLIITLNSMAMLMLFQILNLTSLKISSSNSIYSFSRNWIASSRFLIVLLGEIIGGLSYSCLILF